VANLTLRTQKGTPLTHTELDQNFINLNTAKCEKSANLSDLFNAAAARNELQLGTAATYETTTDNLDAHIGRAMKIGDYGIGTPLPGGVLNEQKLNGIYSVSIGPDSKSGTLFVNEVSQFFLANDGDRYFRRSYLESWQKGLFEPFQGETVMSQWTAICQGAQP